MISPRSVICPVDFSDASRGALRYAAVVANYFHAELTVLTVTDPLLTEAAELSGAAEHLPEAVNKELLRFVKKSFEGGVTPENMKLTVATGKPAVEILRFAKERPADLVVMSTHGLTGMRKLFFGSTTERVLRETTVPVLLIPAHDHGPARVEDVKSAVKRMLIPVDLECGDGRSGSGGAEDRGGARGAGAARPRGRTSAFRGVWSAASPEPRSRAPGPGRESPRRARLQCSVERAVRRRSSRTEIPPRKLPRSRAIAMPD